MNQSHELSIVTINIIEESFILGNISSKLSEFFDSIFHNLLDMNTLKKIDEENKKQVDKYAEILRKNGVDLNKVDDLIDTVINHKLSFKDAFVIALDELKNISATQVFATVVLFLLMYMVSWVVIMGLFKFLIIAGVSHMGAAIFANVIGAIFVAPVTEEAYKRVAVKNHSTILGYIGFNVFEFTKYVSLMMTMGAPAILALLVRIPPLLMHGYNTYLHLEGRLKGELLRRKGVLPKGNETPENIANETATLMHSAWNTGATVLGLVGAGVGAIIGINYRDKIAPEDLKNKILEKLGYDKRVAVQHI